MWPSSPNGLAVADAIDPREAAFAERIKQAATNYAIEAQNKTHHPFDKCLACMGVLGVRERAFMAGFAAALREGKSIRSRLGMS